MYEVIPAGHILISLFEVKDLRKSRSGCLSAVLFLVIALLCVFIVYKMIDSSSGGKAGEALHTVIQKLGMTKKEKETLDQLEKEQQEKDESGKDPGSFFGELPDADVIKIELTEEKLRQLFQEQLDEVFPMTILSLSINEKGIVDFTASMDRDSFLELAEEHDSGLQSVHIMLLKLAPENLDLSGRFKLSYNASSGNMNVDPEKMTLQGVSLPLSVIPSSMSDKFNVAVDKYVSQYGYNLCAVAFYDSYIQLFIE